MVFTVEQTLQNKWLVNANATGETIWNEAQRGKVNRAQVHCKKENQALWGVPEGEEKMRKYKEYLRKQWLFSKFDENNSLYSLKKLNEL